MPRDAGNAKGTRAQDVVSNAITPADGFAVRGNSSPRLRRPHPVLPMLSIGPFSIRVVAVAAAALL
ncbi:hypothetical protein G3N57_35955, partial [Paraburkholderia sp. Se-20369]|nr:hypothetical protein [Paraburkholderia sp. Se-20369]